jgi:hypothetical protein
LHQLLLVFIHSYHCVSQGVLSLEHVALRN